jgi:hypothetical protein
MKDGLTRIDVAITNCPKVDQNKRFLKMVRINIMFNDGGG